MSEVFDHPELLERILLYVSTFANNAAVLHIKDQVSMPLTFLECTRMQGGLSEVHDRKDKTLGSIHNLLERLVHSMTKRDLAIASNRARLECEGLIRSVRDGACSGTHVETDGIQ